MKRIDLKAFVSGKWHLIILLLIVLLGFWLRSFPARYGELQALDPFFLYRSSEYVLQNNWHMDYSDMLRYYPLGVNTFNYVHVVPIYMPAMVYSLISFLGVNIHYLDFAIIWPAAMGALAVLVGYFVGKELFNKKSAGLFAAFFLATTPAFVTRTSAGFFEKECIAGVFLLLTLYFFTRAFKKSSWKHGILAGLSLAVMSGAWGGTTYIYLLFSAFIGVLFLFNIILVVLNYLFSGFESTVAGLEKYIGIDMIKAFVPMMLLGTLLHQLVPVHIALNSMYVIVLYTVLALLLIRYLVERFNLVRKEYIPYVIPTLVFLGFLGVLVGSMFIDFFAEIMQSISGVITIEKGVIGTTVAENMPGSWGEITARIGAGYSGGLVPQLNSIAPYLTLWVFMLLGIAVLLYKFVRTGNWFLFLPLVWIFSSIWATFQFVRLIFLVGPAASIVGGFFLAWLIEKARNLEKGISRFKVTFVFSNAEKKVGIISAIVAIFITLTVIINYSSAYVFARQIGPSICLPSKDLLINGEKCLVINEDGSYTYAPNQPWYQAMGYLSNQSLVNGSVLSWWDFGYWFQTRGNTPSVADGGNLGVPYHTTDYEIADWFVSPTSNWTDFVPWLKHHGVIYILMDYTLPGKYGAISKIASRGESIIGFLQFSQSGAFQQGNNTIAEFKAGQYTVWLPVDANGSITSSAIFLVSQNGQYYSKTYINDICSPGLGVRNVGNEEPSMGGCFALSSVGVFYIPEEAKNSIFVNLMFMDGYGLPVEKVFDNHWIKIYKVNYD